MDKSDDTDQELNITQLTEMFTLQKDIVTILKEKGGDAEKVDELGDEIMKGIADYLINPTQENAENNLGRLRKMYSLLVKPEEKIYH